MRSLRELVAALALLVAGALGAKLWLDAPGGRPAAESAALAPGAPSAVGWAAPVLDLALASPAEEGRVALTPDGALAVFASGRRGLDAELWVVARAADGAWGGALSEARPLAELSSPADELDPAFGGGFLWFASDRAGSGGGLDLWRAPYAGGRFGEAERVLGLATSADERGPAPSADGERVLFASDRAPEREPGGGMRRAPRSGFDLWEALRDDEAPEGWSLRRVDELSSLDDDLDPILSADGALVVFASDRPVPWARGAGFDLWRAVRRGAGFQAPERLAALCTDADERAPSLEDAALALRFARRSAAGDLEPWRAARLELFGEPPSVPWRELLLLALLLAIALAALLARRWRGLDLVWITLALSLIAHILLALWLRRLFLEPEELTPPSRGGSAIQVRWLGAEGGGGEGAAEPARAPLAGAVPPAPSDDARLAPESAVLALDAATSSEEPAPPEPAAAAPDTRAARARAAGELEPTLDASAVSERSVALSEGEAPRPRAGAPLVDPAPPLGARSAARSAAQSPVAVPLLGAALVSAADAGRSPSAPRVLDASPAPAPARAAVGAAPLAPRPPSASALSVPGAREPGPVALADAPASRASRVAREPEPSVKRFDAKTLVGAAPVARSASAPTFAPPPLERALGARSPEAPRAPRAAREHTDTPLVPPVASAHEPERPRASTAPESSPYALRTGTRRVEALERHGGDARTESAVERGLAYLARIQRRLGDDGGEGGGYWGELDVADDKYGHVAIGKTALCLLAFLGAGNTHKEGEHAEVVRRGIAFLLAVQDEESGHFGPTSAYSHGLATLAVAECHSLTKDPALVAPLERALAHLLDEQHSSRDPKLDGGWGYYGPEGRQHDRWPRVSVTAWQVLALVSARLSGLDVPDRALERAREFLLRSEDPREGWLRYSHDPERLRSGWPTLPASTPAGLFALSLLGEDVAAPRHARGLAFVLERAPSAWRRASDDDFVRRARGNPYFWYQGTLLAFRLGGGAWASWNEALKASLLPGQREDGSWPSIDVYAREYARDGSGDASYSSALAVLSLEVYYRYHLPLLRALPERAGAGSVEAAAAPR